MITLHLGKKQRATQSSNSEFWNARMLTFITYVGPRNIGQLWLGGSGWPKVRSLGHKFGWGVPWRRRSNERERDLHSWAPNATDDVALIKMIQEIQSSNRHSTTLLHWIREKRFTSEISEMYQCILIDVCERERWLRTAHAKQNAQGVQALGVQLQKRRSVDNRSHVFELDALHQRPTRGLECSRSRNWASHLSNVEGSVLGCIKYISSSASVI